MKRVFLFVLTNLAILFVLGVVLHLLGIDRGTIYHGHSLNLGTLLVYSLVLGFTGSAISLFLSKWMAKMATGARVIETPANPMEEWLLETTDQLSEQADIDTPEVAIYEAEEINAFATGWDRHHALVAVSTGLLQNMSKDEIEAVLGHEISHVANGDMVTLTLLQGVLNTFVVFLSRVVGYVVDRIVLKNERDGIGLGGRLAQLAAQIVLGLVATVIVMWFSRRREFRADEGGAELAGREKMIAALTRLQAANDETALPREVAAFGISGGGAITRLFMTHPPLEERIEALREAEDDEDDDE